MVHICECKLPHGTNIRIFFKYTKISYKILVVYRILWYYFVIFVTVNQTNRKIVMRRILRAAAAVVLLSTVSLPLHAQDPLLDILRDELGYQSAELAKTPTPPYYMNFRVTEQEINSVSASFGVPLSENEIHSRIFIPHIRLGSPEFDNFRGSIFGFQSAYYGSNTLLPLSDDNPDAIRQAIWEDVEDVYKASVEQLERLRAADKVNTKREDKAPDFATSRPEKYYEAPLTAAEKAFDKAEMERRVKAYSAIFLDTPDIINCSATIEYKVLRKYLVANDGTEVVHNNRYCLLMINAGVRTDDGMNLPLYKSYFAFSPDGLPSDEEVFAETRRIAATLVEMKDAPVVDPYTGPALLAGEASGVFFHEIFGHRIEAQRMKSDSDGQTFKKMVGQDVLPRHFSVYDDPTLAQWEDGSDLHGYYLYDDQGVKARRVDVVRNGVLNEFLTTRVPTDEFAVSNGHARAQENLNPTSRQSNLVVETSRHLTEDQLRKLLIKEAKAQDREFGLYFKDVTGGFTQTGRYNPNSFNVTPLEVYKIYVDGRPDELVRGVDLIGTPLSMFANIAEAGGETEVFTGTCGAESGRVPVTGISPKVLVTKVEVQRKAKTSDTPPVLPRP